MPYAWGFMRAYIFADELMTFRYYVATLFRNGRNIILQTRFMMRAFSPRARHAIAESRRKQMMTPICRRF